MKEQADERKDKVIQKGCFASKKLFFSVKVRSTATAGWRESTATAITASARTGSASRATAVAEDTIRRNKSWLEVLFTRHIAAPRRLQVLIGSVTAP